MKGNNLFLQAAVAVAALVLVLSPVGARAEGSEFPTGKYTTTITYDDVAKYGLSPEYHAILEGDWKLIFGADGVSMATNLTTGAFGQGAYIANPTVLIFGKDSGELDCIPPGNAVYKWAASGDVLTLNALGGNSERCWGRYIVYTSHPLVKAP